MPKDNFEVLTSRVALVSGRWHAQEVAEGSAATFTEKKE